MTVAAVLAIQISTQVAIGRHWLQYCRYTYGYTWPLRDSGCSAGDTHMDTSGEWVTVAVLLAKHIRIHVVRVLTVAVVLSIHIWIHVASG